MSTAVDDLYFPLMATIGLKNNKKPEKKKDQKKNEKSR